MPLQQVVEQLEAAHGRPKPPRIVDPWLLVLWENVAYLADDERREKAFLALRQEVGTRPEQILSAPDQVLLGITGHGILPEQFAGKLRRCAAIALEDFDGDLRPILAWPLPKAKKALMRFPGVGEPGAEKILLFAGKHPALALESNGLRVLVRLGFGEEKKSYAETYRLVRRDAEVEIRGECAWLIKTHQLLRRHGQETCRRTRPRCGECPLAANCLYRQTQGDGSG
jgi:endonuclease III